MADTDLELLELAARAVGAKMTDYSDKTPDHWLFPNEHGYWVKWEPLANDAQAFRLAVKLGISIMPYPIYNSEERHSVIAKQRRRSDMMREPNPTLALEIYGDDEAAAWRRAIVRCAAEIGRAA